MSEKFSCGTINPKQTNKQTNKKQHGVHDCPGRLLMFDPTNLRPMRHNKNVKEQNSTNIIIQNSPRDHCHFKSDTTSDQYYRHFIMRRIIQRVKDILHDEYW